MPASFETTASTGNLLVDAVDSGYRWNGAVTYNRVDPANPSETGAFASALPSPYQTLATGVTNAIWDLVVRQLNLLRTYATFDFELADTAVDANYFVSDFSNPNNVDSAGIAARPSSTPILAFNVSTWGTYSDQQQDWIVLHELGHTLGLRHPAELPASLDYAQYTIMAYNWFDLGDEEFGEGLPRTPMALDIAVLQAKYGAAASNTGDTRYTLTRFLLDLNGADGLVENGGGFFCIWDTGGDDTLAYAGSTGALLNLNAATLQTSPFTGDLADVIGDVAAVSRIFGGFSAAAKTEFTDPVRAAGGFFSSLLTPTGREPAGYTIANGARIEAASGGSGDDLLVGNAFANRLQGNAGNDELFGGSGDDTLDGGAGNDRVYGGQGSDTIGDGGGSNYLRGDEGDDSLNGGPGFDDINGNMGADTASGGQGEDWVVGGKDDDRLSGGDAFDLVYGNLGNDTIAGDAGDDIVRGGQQDDLLSGGAGNDFLSGDRDNDTITGGAGADIFSTHGEAGIDRVTDFNLAEGDRVQLAPGTQYTLAQVGDDTVINMTGGGQMILVGVAMSSLTGAWIFGA